MSFAPSPPSKLACVCALGTGELFAAIDYCNNFPESARAYVTNQTLPAVLREVEGSGRMFGLPLPYLYMILSGAFAYGGIAAIVSVVRHFGATAATLVTSIRSVTLKGRGESVHFDGAFHISFQPRPNPPPQESPDDSHLYHFLCKASEFFLLLWRHSRHWHRLRERLGETEKENKDGIKLKQFVSIFFAHVRSVVSK
jgi:hypothetical protein